MGSALPRATALLILALLLAAPALSLGAKADVYPEQVTGEVIKIGMTISLTGKFQTEGTQALCGIKAAIKWYNDQGGVDIGGKKYKLQLIYYDDESKKDNIASLYTKLIDEDQVDFLLAPYSSTLTLAALPVANEKQKLILSHGGASDTIVESGYKYIVQVLTPASRYMETAAELVAEKIPDAKIALIFENKPFAQKVKQGLKAKIQELGLQVVYEADYEAGTKDFSTFIQEAMSRGANVLLGGGHYEDGKALVGQAHSLGWKLKFIAILVAPAQPKFRDELGDQVVTGVAYPSQWSQRAPYTPEKAKELGLTWAGPTIDEWVSLFKEVCPNLEAPAYQAAEAGAAIVYLVEAIKKAYEMYGEAAIKDSDKVREAFNGLKIMTFFGPLEIDPATGKQIGHPMILMQWQEGERYIIYPPEVAEREPLIAPPNWWPAETTTPTQTQTSPTASSPAATTPTTTETITTQAGGVSPAIIAAIVIIIIVIVAAVLFMRR